MNALNGLLRRTADLLGRSASPRGEVASAPTSTSTSTTARSQTRPTHAPTPSPNSTPASAPSSAANASQSATPRFIWQGPTDKFAIDSPAGTPWLDRWARATNHGADRIIPSLIIGNRDELLRTVTTLADRNLGALVLQLPDLGPLDSATRLDVARIIGDRSIGALTKALGTLAIDDVGLLLRCASEEPGEFLEHASPPNLDEADRSAIAEQVAAAGVSKLFWVADVATKRPEPFGRLVLDALALKVGPVALLRAADERLLETLEGEPFVKLAEHLTAYAEQFPQRLAPERLQLVLEASRNAATVTGLLHISAPYHAAHVADITALVALCTGLQLHPPRRGYSGEAIAEVYALLVDIQKQSATPVFEMLRLDPSVTADRRLVALRSYLRAFRDDALIRDTPFETPRSDDPLEAAELEAIAAGLQAAVTKRASELLGTNAGPLLETIAKRWGDTESVITLAARFNGREDWRNCNPVLGRVLESVADETFDAFKFSGPQLAVLSQAQRVEWVRERCVVRGDFGATAEADNPARQLSRFKNEAKTTILHHLPASSVGPFVEIARGMAQAATLDELRQNVTQLQILLNRGAFAGDVAKQLRMDLTSLAVAMRPANHERRAAAVVTVVTHHPKIALEVGDLVRASSCQSFRTGSHVHSLLGYVVDANVQVMASFAIDASSFAHAEEGRAVLEALRTGGLTATFDGNDRTVEFFLADGHRVRSLPMGNALRRQMLKLGVSAKGKPALMLERAYVANNPSESLMESAHDALLQDVAKALGAKTNVAMTCIKSRGPHGVYADSAGGIQTDDYEIH